MRTVRKEREAELARSLIIQSALAVFTQKGYHGATMDEIARTAGYSPAAVYRYFHSKDDIFRAALETVTEQFSALVREVPPVSLPFVERLRWMFLRMVALAQANRDFFIAFIAQRGYIEWDLRTDIGQAVDCARREHLAQIAAIMERGLAEGALAPANPVTYALAFIGMAHAFLGRWILEGASRPFEDEVNTMLSLFMHGAAARKD